MKTEPNQKPEAALPPMRFPLQVRHILVPLDFSGASRQALDYAVPLAQKFEAKITLMHAVPPQIVYPEAGMAVVDEAELTEAAKKTMALRTVELVPPALLKEAVVRNGRPSAEIVRFAQEQDVDLIVMTTHGYTGFAHAFLGSTAEQVIRHAPCPVLAVRQR